MSYKMEIIHRNKKIDDGNNGSIKFKYSIGHFAVCLRKDDTEDSCIGKYPRDASIVSSPALLETEKEKQNIKVLQHKSQVDQKPYLHVKTLKLSQAQYEQALQYVGRAIKCGLIEMESDVDKAKCGTTEQYYHILTNNCIDFVQAVYHAAGLPLYFTATYSKQELKDLGSGAARKALNKYGSMDNISKKLHSITAESKAEVAMMLNIDPSNVNTSSQFLHCMKQNTFSVKIDDNLWDSVKDLTDVGSNSGRHIIDTTISTQGIIEEIHALFAGFKMPPKKTINDDIAKAGTSKELAINQNSKIRIKELYVSLATVKLNLGKIYLALSRKLEGEEYINEYSYQAAELYIQDKILLNWQSSIDLLISLRKDNLELYIKEHNSLLENTNDQNKQLVSNKILAEIYKQQGNPLQYQFFSNAYKLQQAPIDNDAILIGQKEAGFSNNIKIGTSDIRECLIVIIHEPIDHGTVLIHIDSATSVELAISEVMGKFDKDKHLNVSLVGARYISRDFDGYEDSEFNLVRTLTTIFKYQNIYIQSIDVGDAIPFALVFNPISGKLKVAYPNKVMYGHNPDFAWQDLGHNIHYVFDCIADNILYYPPSFDDKSIKIAINTFLFKEESFFKKESEYSCYQKHKFYEFCDYFRLNNFELFIKSISPPEELDKQFLETILSKISNLDTPLYQIQLEIQSQLDKIKEEVSISGDLLTLDHL